MIGDILQPTHLLLILAVALLVLGPKRLPEVGRQLGSGLRDFRAAINGERPDRHEEPLDLDQPPPAPSDIRTEPSETPAEHQFAHDASEPVADHHVLGEDEGTDAAANGHEFAQAAVDGSVSASGGAVSSSPGDLGSAGETMPAGEARANPLS